MNIWLWIAVIILVVYVIIKRNSFARLYLDIRHSSSQISNYMEKRAATLNDALNIAKIGYADEVKGIEKLSCEQQLDQLRYLGERYPSLNSIGNYTTTLNQAFGLNADITACREVLNGNINEYNRAVKSFPGVLVAVLFGYKEEKYIDEESFLSNRQLSKAEVDYSKFQS